MGDKKYWAAWLSSQMTSDVYEDVKVKKLTPVTQADGTKMMYLDYSYNLLTRAGFNVPRRGVASAMEASGAVVGLVTTTTAERYKDLEPSLRSAAESFRAYPVKSTAFMGGKGMM